MALLAALRELRSLLGIRLLIAHLHHGLRGADADEDARFVRRMARRWKVPCVIGRADVRARARRRGISREMAAREARYAFLARVARRRRADLVATAHTVDDQAETVLLQLARGAGSSGLSGLSPSVTLAEARVIRPMLEISRTAVLAYLTARGIPWREDATNADLSILRNRVRHRVLPVLERELNPAVRGALARTAEVLREEDAYLEAQAAHQLAMSRAATAHALRIEALRAVPVAIRRRVLRRWLLQLGVPPPRLTYEILEKVRSILEGNGGRRMDAGDGWVVIRRDATLEAVRKTEVAPVLPFRVRVLIPGETCVPEKGIRILARMGSGCVRDRNARVGSLPASATLRRAAIGRRRLWVRSWRPGDRIRPLGLNGTRKLQDVFVDAKVPAERRRHIPVFECAGQIVWLPGYRVARGWEAIHSREPAVHLQVIPLEPDAGEKGT